MDELKSTLDQAAEAAQETVAEAADKVEETAAAAEEAVKDAAADAADKAEAAADQAQEAVKDAAEATAEKAEAAADQAQEAAKEAAGKAAEAGESMADYEAELNASFRSIHEGDMLTGTVVGVAEDKVTVDIGYYTDGIIRLEDCSDDPSFSIKNDIKVGETVTATVLNPDDHGHIRLSLKAAARLQAWERLRALLESKENVTVKIAGVTKSGVIAYLEGMRAFIPASRLSTGYVEEDALNDFLGKTMEVRVITADESANKLVLSAREILREKEAEERKQRISNVQVGFVTEGTVETIKDYGAFINLGKGLSGLLHVSQISHTRVKNPAAVLKEGQTVRVKVIAVKDGKLSLSMKALEDAPAEEVEEEVYELPKAEAVTTSLASLLKDIKLD